MRRFFLWARLVVCAVSCLVLFRILLGDRRLDILQRQLHLLAIKPFGPPAELRTLKLLQQMAKPIVLLRHAPAFFNRRVALARQLAHQRPQGIEIIRESIDRHASILESDSRCCDDPTRNLIQ